MTQVFFHDAKHVPVAVECDPAGSLLEDLLAAGIKIPNSCRKGLCQACACQINDKSSVSTSALNPEALGGLSPLQRRNNYFLSCQTKPVDGLAFGLPSHDDDWLCELKQKRYLSPSVVELTFQSEGRWKAGQHLLLWKDDRQARPYSASNDYCEDRLIRFIVERHSKGVVSRWCYDELSVGESIRFSAPQGSFIVGSDFGSGLVVFAEGSGVGPANGLLQSAQGDRLEVPCDLFFVHSRHSVSGAETGQNVTESDRYFPESLWQSAAAGSLVNVHLASPDIAIGDDGYALLHEQLKSKCTSLRGKKVFIVGSEPFVSSMSRACFFGGAARNDIVTETFLSQSSTA